MKNNLVLLGMMGVGKSTLGKIVAKRLNLEFIDTDSNIEKRCAMKILDIFKKKGEQYFREQEEKEVLKSLKKKDCVIALGGGAFINQKVRENVLNKTTISIWLHASLKTLNKRIKWNNKRPLLNEHNNDKKIYTLYAERKDIYKLANHKIVCDKLSKEEIAKKIIFYYENN